MVIVGAPQRYYEGAEWHEVTSQYAGNKTNAKSFTVSLPQSDTIARMAKGFAKQYGGASAQGQPMIPMMLES